MTAIQRKTKQMTTTQTTEGQQMTAIQITEGHPVWTNINTMINSEEYVCKYKGSTFHLKDSPYPQVIGFRKVELSVVKDYEKKLITEIFVFDRYNHPKNTTVMFQGVQLKTDKNGMCETPWVEVGNKAIAYIDAISN